MVPCSSALPCWQSWAISLGVLPRDAAWPHPSSNHHLIMNFQFFTTFSLIVITASLCAEPLSLDALAAQAVAKNPEISYFEAEIAAAKGGRKTAGQIANPEVSAQGGGKRVKDLGGAGLGNGAAWSVSVSQTFEWPGRLALRKAVADRQIELAELGLDEFKTALSAKVRSLGFTVSAAQEKEAAARAAAKRFQDVLSVLVQRDDTGPTPLLESRILEANVLSLTRRASEAAQELQKARVELNQLIGQPLDNAVEISTPKVALPPAPGDGVLLSSAWKQNFAVRRRVVELNQQGFAVRLTENERMPSVTVAPYVAGEKANDKQTEIGLSLSIPLPLWNRNEGNIETAKARQQQAEAALGMTRRELEREVATRSAAYRKLLEEISAWQPDTVSKFREAAELADRHYRLGAVPVVTYMEMQRSYLDALDAMFRAQADAFENRQQLELLTGKAFAK